MLLSAFGWETALHNNPLRMYASVYGGIVTGMLGSTTDKTEHMYISRSIATSFSIRRWSTMKTENTRMGGENFTRGNITYSNKRKDVFE